jgi:hypothetical protein
MRKILVITLTILCFVSCDPDNSVAPQQKGALQFSFSNSSLFTGRSKGDAQPAYALISITDGNNKSIYNNKEIPLYALGDKFLSGNIELASSALEYKLTDFVILNTNRKSIFITPKEGSTKADLVDDPLPIHFKVTANSTTSVVPQVLVVTDDSTPEEFGYVAFGFEVVEEHETPLKINEIMKFTGDKDHPDSKIKYYYKDNLVSKTEEYYYLPEYDVYYLAFTEEYFYKNDILSSTNFKIKGSTLVYTFDYEYLPDGVIEHQTHYYGQFHEKLHDYKFSIQGSTLTATDYYYIGYTPQEYLTTGTIDGNQNPVYLKHYDLNKQADSEETIEYMEVGINPLTAPYSYLRKWDIMRLSKSLPKQETFKNLQYNNSISILEYSYHFNESNYPTEITITNSNSYDNQTTTSTMKISYY